MRTVVMALHLLQPAARLWGRVSFGLTPWRRRGDWPFVFPWKRSAAVWHEKWRSLDERLAELETALRDSGAMVCRGGDYDRWDLEVRVGVSGSARALMTVEEHGQGKQFVRIKIQPTGSHWIFIVVPFLAAVAISAGVYLEFTQAMLLAIP